jgi:hypothetical protein
MLNRLLIYNYLLRLYINTTECTATLQCSFLWTRVNRVSNIAKTCKQPIFPWKRQRFIGGKCKSQPKYFIVVSRKAVPFKLSQYNIPHWRRLQANRCYSNKRFLFTNTVQYHCIDESFERKPRISKDTFVKIWYVCLSFKYLETH